MESEKLSKHNWPKNSIPNILEEPIPDHREALWGSDFRSFIPSPMYAPSEIVKSLEEIILEAPTPQRSSCSCTFWIFVTVASIVLIAAGIIVPLVAFNNAQAPSQSIPETDLAYKPPLSASTDEKTNGNFATSGWLKNHLLNVATETIFNEESEVHMRDENLIKELKTLPTIEEKEENGVEAILFPKNSNDGKADLKLAIENTKDRLLNLKNRVTQKLDTGLVHVLCAVPEITTVAGKIYKGKRGFENDNKRKVVENAEVAIVNCNNDKNNYNSLRVLIHVLIFEHWLLFLTNSILLFALSKIVLNPKREVV